MKRATKKFTEILSLVSRPESVPSNLCCKFVLGKTYSKEQQASKTFLRPKCEIMKLKDKVKRNLKTFEK
jgi:hypothetical protein